MTRRVTCLAKSPFCDRRVTLLAGLAFLHINTMALDSRVISARQDNQSMRERYWLGQRGQLVSKVDSADRVNHLPGTGFLHIKGGFTRLQKALIAI